MLTVRIKAYVIVVRDDYMSIFMYDSTLSFPADRSGPAAVLRELVLHDRQPDILTNEHDHRHEHGEQSAHQCSLMTAAGGDECFSLAHPYLSRKSVSKCQYVGFRGAVYRCKGIQVFRLLDSMDILS